MARKKPNPFQAPPYEGPALFRHEHGLISYLGDRLIHGWNDKEKPCLILPSGASHYGVVLEGVTTLEFDGIPRPSPKLSKGMYFCVPDYVKITGGKGVVFSQEETNALYHVGGPLGAVAREPVGDGCMSTSLIASPLAILNYLTVPPDASRQEPDVLSVHAGVVISGSGVFVANEERLPMKAGHVFLAPKGSNFALYPDVHGGDMHDPDAPSLGVVSWFPVERT